MKTLSEIRPCSLVSPNLMMDKTFPLEHRIAHLERMMLTMPQVEIPIEEYEGDGFYMREMRMPAGTFLLGRVHKYSNMNVMGCGSVYVWTAHDDLVHYEGYNVIEAFQGVQRIMYAVKDTIWTTILRMKKGEPIEDPMDYYTSASYEQYLAFKRDNFDPLEATGWTGVEGGMPRLASSRDD